MSKRVPIGAHVRAVAPRQRGARWRGEIRWRDPETLRIDTASRSFVSRDRAQEWIDTVIRDAHGGIDPHQRELTFAEFVDQVTPLVSRQFEKKTWVPYGAGLRLRAVPAAGHVPLAMQTAGLWDRIIHQWRSATRDDGTPLYSDSTIKCTVAAVSAVMEQAVRDGLLPRNPLRDRSRSRKVGRETDHEDDLRSKALADITTLNRLCDGLTARAGGPEVWAQVVIMLATTAARIAEVAGMRLCDVARDGDEMVWTVRRQSTPGPGGLLDKGTKGKRIRRIPLIPPAREVLARRIATLGDEAEPLARVFTGPRGGRITTAILRDATHWDEVVASLGLPGITRHTLRHTAATWMVDSGMSLEIVQDILGHADIATTRRYVHPDKRARDAGMARYAARWCQFGATGTHDGPLLRVQR